MALRDAGINVNAYALANVNISAAAFNFQRFPDRLRRHSV